MWSYFVSDALPWLVAGMLIMLLVRGVVDDCRAGIYDKQRKIDITPAIARERATRVAQRKRELDEARDRWGN